MAPLALTERGEEMLRDLPPFFYEDPDWRAVIHCYAMESERLEGHVEEVRAQFFPQQATVLLRAWEATFDLTVAPLGLTEEQRREQIALALIRMVASEGGEDWEAFVERLTGAGYTYEEFDPQVPSNTVPAHTIRVTLPFPPSSDTYQRIQRALLAGTPANTDIIVQSGGGFTLDQDSLDSETFGGF